MHETYDKKRRGQSLSAAHVNNLSTVARMMSAGATASFNHSFRGVFHAVTSPMPFQQEILVCVEDLGSEVWLAHRRYYDATSMTWNTDTVRQHRIHNAEFHLDLQVGTKLVAFWHLQSRFWIPIGAPVAATVLKVGKAYQPIAVGARDGIVTVWQEDDDGDMAPTEEQIEEVRHDWITNAQPIAEDTEVILGWFGDEGFWRIIGAECD